LSLTIAESSDLRVLGLPANAWTPASGFPRARRRETATEPAVPWAEPEVGEAGDDWTRADPGWIACPAPMNVASELRCLPL